MRRSPVRGPRFVARCLQGHSARRGPGRFASHRLICPVVGRDQGAADALETIEMALPKALLANDRGSGSEPSGPGVAYTEIKSFSQPSCVSRQIVGPVPAPGLSPAVTNMHFGRDASLGPTDPRVPWRAPLLAHGAALPCGHVSSRNRQQHGVGHVSSHPLGRVLVALYAPRAGAKRSYGG